ncbi:alpha/beta fold hydrolase [Ideonella sp. BN130291]|uniref:alpha/beta fold hydrolase n=1 Tax=Ideonella sp. BN130291 TaxID=3112940 RepID=UPI002E262536|nr:alpha/beta hydrolase [Ideonella sp. BN130291]
MIYPPEVEHQVLEANGQRLYTAAAGPADGPLVILLHGFPEFSFGWRHQLGALAAAGLRAVAPDQRGYGLSSKPKGHAAYALPELARDVVALARALGRDRFSVVGHDWGGLVAWQLAACHDDTVQRAAILNAPHPQALRQHLWRSPTQALRSAYIAFFQLPWAPEALLGAHGHALLEQALVGSSREGTFSEEELRVYRDAWSQEGALTSMLNWYRAITLNRSARWPRVRLPVRLLWGDRDSALEAPLAEASAAACGQGEVIHLPQATHWLHHEEPERVNALLVEFLQPLLSQAGTCQT